jgi:hypothetical protein
MTIQEEQRALCIRLGAKFAPASASSTLGISLNVRTDLLPLNGLRHPPANGSNGWFIWAGDVLEPREDFFVPLHLQHVGDWRREALKFLALPPGWRFLVADAHEDVWFDATLLEV